ncbi:MAG: hypothetical protein R2851_01815 [Caldilineaceae bacterium]
MLSLSHRHQRLTERLNSGGPADMATWQAEVDDITFTMKEVSACGLGMAAPALDLMRYFPDQVVAHVET